MQSAEYLMTFAKQKYLITSGKFLFSKPILRNYGNTTKLKQNHISFIFMAQHSTKYRMNDISIKLFAHYFKKTQCRLAIYKYAELIVFQENILKTWMQGFYFFPVNVI